MTDPYMPWCPACLRPLTDHYLIDDVYGQIMLTPDKKAVMEFKQTDYPVIQCRNKWAKLRRSVFGDYLSRLPIKRNAHIGFNDQVSRDGAMRAKPAYLVLLRVTETQ